MPVHKHEGNDDDDDTIITKNNNNIEYFIDYSKRSRKLDIRVCVEIRLKIFNSNVIARVLGSCSVFFRERL